MVQKVIWSDQAIKEYDSIVSHLLTTFGKSSVDAFHMRLSKKLTLVQTQPKLYPLSRKRNIRKTVVHKRLIIFYNYRPRLNRVEIISLWDTRRQKK